MAFLDETGLGHLWTRIMEKLGKKVDSIENGENIKVIKLETEDGSNSYTVSHEEIEATLENLDPIELSHGDSFTIQQTEIVNGHTTKIVKQTLQLPNITEADINQKQSDWEENDENSKSFIKNRTHWVEEGREILLTEQTLSADDDYINDMRSYDFLGLSEIIVRIDGIEYKCPFQEALILEGIVWENVFSSENSPFYFDVTYGEDVTLGLDPNYPTANEFVWQFHIKPSYIDSFGGTHLVQIEKLTGELNYHPIDEKYVPEKFHNKQDKIKYGTSLPASGVNGQIFLLLEG